ncbi:O-antigen ligase family protein [Euzebya sp.]|uniref:O-antigen ligase family protein n=1 Tax=Euzebya sp. TaxID=1971409 RepID=UPI0035196454
MATLVEERTGLAPVSADAGRPVALAVVALAVLSVVAVDPWGFVPHGPLRWASTTTALLTAVALTRGTLHLPRGMATAWLVLLAALGVSAATGLDPLHAWIGTPDRRMGWLAWLGLAAAWVVGTTLWPHRRTVLRGLVVAGGLLVLGAGADALGWLPDDGVTGRIGGTYGQPAHLAAMCTLLLPVAVGVALARDDPPPWRGGAAVVTVGLVITTLATQTRGAWIGLLVASALVARPAADRVRSRPLVAVAVGVVAGAVVLLTPIGARVVAAFDLEDGGTAGGRLAEWAVAARVVADHPWTGVGPEGYRIAFPAAVDVGYAATYGRDVITDRAHNGLLDVTVAGGLPAGAAHLVLTALALRLAWRARSDLDTRTAGIAVAVVAYVVQQQALFPLAEVDPVHWVLVGLLTARDLTARDLTGHETPPTVGLRAAALRLPALALLVAVVAAGTLGVVADHRMARAADLAVPPTTGRALAVADAAVRLRPDDIRLRFAAARIAARGGRIVDVDAALDRIDAGLELSPRDPALRAERADLLLERARRSGLPGDLTAAVTTARTEVAADPTDPAAHVRLGTVLAYAGEHDQASRAADAAAAIDPDADGIAALRALLALDLDAADGS